jgi:hypothetical protein
VSPDEVAVVEDGDLGSGDVVFGEGAAGEVFGFGGGNVRAVEAADVCLLSLNLWRQCKDQGE